MYHSIQNSRRRKIVAMIVTSNIILIALFSSSQSWRSASAQEAIPDGAIVNLSTRNHTAFFGASEDVILQVKFTNPNDHSLKLLKWLTPLEGVQEPIFTVLRDGEPVAYLGPIFKRVVPTARDYLSLAAGESLVTEADLSTIYDFSTAGNYEISFEVASSKIYSVDLQGWSELNKTGSLTSNTVEVVIEEHSAVALPKIEAQAVTGQSGFNNCTASRQTDIINARNSASNFANDGMMYLNVNNPGIRYSTWFGTYDLGRYNTVASHFNNIRNAIDTASMTFDCSCTNPFAYAYVYPLSPYNIYLCGAFWPAPMTGTDSKAGTLVHETSHFKVVASTIDYAYGQSAAKTLAINSPAQAIMNADNHEYFAENNPPIEKGTFADAPTIHWAWQYIESIYNASITGGCGTSPLIYCPESAVTRAQMAVFLEKGVHGSSFAPPDVTPTFNDTAGHWAEDWIEALKSDGVTSGCGNGMYCPENAVTRAQMAVFLLKAKYGYNYNPPPASGIVFGDVPASYWAASWIERLAAEGITGGCSSGMYCPESSVTRAQMAVFLQKTFNLALP